uniref:Calpain catalytic domain-containing protein n=1 Tax=Romanomermis culicivorax TaxID=13658 RepID=A0A915IXH5_ROMCU
SRLEGIATNPDNIEAIVKKDDCEELLIPSTEELAKEIFQSQFCSSNKILDANPMNAIKIKAYLKEDKSNPSLFVDTEQFPAEVKSLYKRCTYGENSAWSRPHDLLSNAKIIHEFRNEIIDILPGFVENSAFVLACSVIIQKEELIKQIFPNDQSLYGEKYTGLINCRFWRFGTWIDVFIDDRLPCFNNALKTCRSSVINEFWPALCEKAYAKLHGVYEALEYCRFVDILVDFTGFIVEAYDLHEPQKNLYKILCRAIISGAAIFSFLETDWDSESIANNNSMSLNNNESKKSSSALHRRAYNIIDLKRVKRKTGNECLIKIRNPWSLGREWNGPWSDNDHRWSLVDDKTKKWLQFIKKEDGEYWMSFRDFCHYFQQAKSRFLVTP